MFSKTTLAEGKTYPKGTLGQVAGILRSCKSLYYFNNNDKAS